MNTAIHTQQGLAIIHVTDRMTVTDERYFSVDYWQQHNAVAGTAQGRGNTWFIEAPFGSVVLRQYLRGGLVAKISRDQYFFTSVERSRPFREFVLLTRLVDQGLPVSKPVAALCEHAGLFSKGALMTETIAGAQTLADLISSGAKQESTSEETWQSIGQCIRRFHQAGVWHADLNARNILLDTAGKVYLIDFDRARITPDTKVDGQSNLKRLKRSLDKLWPAELANDLSSRWQQLNRGYNNE